MSTQEIKKKKKKHAADQIRMLLWAVSPWKIKYVDIWSLSVTALVYEYSFYYCKQ